MENLKFKIPLQRDASAFGKGVLAALKALGYSFSISNFHLSPDNEGMIFTVFDVEPASVVVGG